MSELVRGSGGDVLLLSQRRMQDLVAFCVPYELEDVVTAVSGADRVEVAAADRAALERARRVYRAARLATRSPRLSWRLAPRPAAVTLARDYALFFPVFNNAYELHTLAAVPGWRRHAQRAACYVHELIAEELPDYLLELLAEFDHVFVGTLHVVEEVARITGRPCSYLPAGVDVIRFAPYPHAPERVIEVANIGRRSPVTHAALVRMAAERPVFYYYDTVASSGPGGKQRTFRVQSAREHRLLHASILKRSRFFLANRSRVNEPEAMAGHDEMSYRFYEGAAAGTVMLGEAPRIDEFARQFPWPDALIPLPFDSPDIAERIDALDRDPDRLARIRRDNVRNAALQHDWLRRLAVVYRALGLTPTAHMREREEALDAIASAHTAGARGLAPVA